MPRTIVDQLASMLDQAFQCQPNASPTDGWHSLLGNLDTVRDEDWTWLPPGGKRSIEHIAIHCGFALQMYADYGFGPGNLQPRDSTRDLGAPPFPRASVVKWLTESYRLLRDRLAASPDADLDSTRATHWGELKPRRWFAETMIEHLLYHAGEINHIRALAQQNDTT